MAWPTLGCWLMTREAVMGETPACLATSRMVTLAPTLRLRWGIVDPLSSGHGPAGGRDRASLLVRLARRLGCAAETAVGLRREEGEHGIGGGVLRQVGRVDLVERVVGVVVQVEVAAAVLSQPAPGAADRGQRRDVRPRSAPVGQMLDAQRRERFGDAPGGGLRLRGRAGVEPVDAARAEVAFRGDHVVGHLAGVAPGVFARTDQTLFLVGE